MKTLNRSLTLALALGAGSVVFASSLETRLINGTPVKPGLYKEVVQIKVNGTFGCTATLIGPKVILTAAHCAPAGSKAVFTVKGKEYEATLIRSPLYPQKDHDIALGVVNKKVKKVIPATLGEKPVEGLEVTLMGYGCTKPSGGDVDNILREGTSVIVGFDGFDLITRKPNGAALCFGDSGGPLYVHDEDGYTLLGIASKGNIQDTSYFQRVDDSDSLEFINSVIEEHEVEICGINLDC